MLRQLEGVADGKLLSALKFLATLYGVIWIMLVIIALFLVSEPDDGEVTVHTQFLLVCFTCLALIPDFARKEERNEK